MAVVAPPSEVLGLLGSGIISVLNWNSVRNGISSNERKRRVLLRVQVWLRGEDNGRMVLELHTIPFWVFKVAVRGSGRRGEMMMVLVRTTHMGIRAEGKVGAVHWQRVRVKRISAVRERGVVFRPQVKIFPVLSNIRECITTDHGRIVSLVVRVRRESSLKVVSSPGDVSPGRVLTTVLVLSEVGYIWTNGVGVIELLHERTSRVWIGNLMMLLLPGMMNNRIIMGIVEYAPNRLKVKGRFKVGRRAVVGHVVWGRSAGGWSVRVWCITVEL
jgi:hypothetical protein